MLATPRRMLCLCQREACRQKRVLKSSEFPFWGIERNLCICLQLNTKSRHKDRWVCISKTESFSPLEERDDWAQSSAWGTSLENNQVKISSFMYCFASSLGFEDPSSPTRDWAQVTAVQAPHPNHWTERELPHITISNLKLDLDYFPAKRIKATESRLNIKWKKGKHKPGYKFWIRDDNEKKQT